MNSPGTTPISWSGMPKLFAIDVRTIITADTTQITTNAPAITRDVHSESFAHRTCGDSTPPRIAPTSAPPPCAY